MHKLSFVKGDYVWTTGDQFSFAIIIQDGLFAFSRATDVTPFKRGAFVGDMKALVDGGSVADSLVCLESGAVYAIYEYDLLKFFVSNPGLQLRFMGTRFVE